MAAGAVMACSGGPPAREGQTSAPPRSVAALIEEADRLIAQSEVLDYRAPRDRDARLAPRRAGIERLVAACRRGHEAACWRAAVRQTGGAVREREALLLAVGANCLAGDELSCRALTLHELRSPFEGADELRRARERCIGGLAVACVWAMGDAARPAQRTWLERGCRHGDAGACDELAVRAKDDGATEDEIARARERAVERARVECDRGYARSCARLAGWGAGAGEVVLAAAERGCSDGLLGECVFLHATEAPQAVRDWGTERDCVARGFGCNLLAELRTTPDGARDAYEHACQLGSTRDCFELAKRYLAGQLPEPVPGRGKDLAELLCTEDRKPEACALLHR